MANNWKRTRSQKVVYDTSQLDAIVKRIEGLPTEVRNHIKYASMPKASQHVARFWVAELPSGDPDDRAKRGKGPDQDPFRNAPKLKTTVDYVIRDIGRVGLNAFIGTVYPKSNKINFDYHGQTDRLMSFWAKKGHPTRYRARVKKKRWVAKIVHDLTYPEVIRILEKGVDDAVVQHMEKKTDG